MSPSMLPEQRSAPVPWRTIFAACFAVVVTLAALFLVYELRRVILWLSVAVFFAVVLNPAVDWVERRLRVRRTVAALLVFLLGFAAFSGMMYAIVRPLVDQAQTFADDFPRFVDDAQHGRGAVGRLIKRYNLDDWVNDPKNQDQLRRLGQSAGQLALQNV